MLVAEQLSFRTTIIIIIVVKMVSSAVLLHTGGDSSLACVEEEANGHQQLFHVRALELLCSSACCRGFSWALERQKQPLKTQQRSS